jgi:putative transposase
MKQVLKAKLKLLPTPEQAQALWAIGLAYRNAANFASVAAFGPNKITNASLLHKTVYEEVRQTFGLPSQLACSIIGLVDLTQSRVREGRDASP